MFLALLTNRILPENIWPFKCRAASTASLTSGRATIAKLPGLFVEVFGWTTMNPVEYPMVSSHRRTSIHSQSTGRLLTKILATLFCCLRPMLLWAAEKNKRMQKTFLPPLYFRVFYCSGLCMSKLKNPLKSQGLILAQNYCSLSKLGGTMDLITIGIVAIAVVVFVVICIIAGVRRTIFSDLSDS